MQDFHIYISTVGFYWIYLTQTWKYFFHHCLYPQNIIQYSVSMHQAGDWCRLWKMQEPVFQKDASACLQGKAFSM